MCPLRWGAKWAVASVRLLLQAMSEALLPQRFFFFLQTIARQDIWNGDGICLIDPHGDLAEDMLAYIPKERAKDVVYFEA